MWVVLLPSLFNPACGGKTPAPVAPTAAPTPRAPATLVVVSGETGQPVSGASVVIAGQTLRADASGQVAVPSTSSVGAFVDLVSPGFLDRQTLLREGAAPPRVTLWPSTSLASGLDQHFTATLVYTSTSDGSLIGGQAMRRIRAGTTAVYVVLSANLQSDAESVSWHQLGADSIVAATGGKVIYQLSASPPAGATVINVSYDPSNAGCTGTVRGFSSARTAGGEIVGGTIVYCAADAPRSGTVVHELGHSFGLFHSPNRQDVMFPTFVSGRSEVYTPREALAMRLMMDRAAGTRFPDNDRETNGVGALADGVHVIRCAG